MKIRKRNVDLVLSLRPPTETEAAHLILADPASGFEFCRVELDPGDLEALLYGERRSCRSTVSGLGKFLGATRITESRTVPYYGSPGDDHKTIESWVAANKHEDGWFVDPRVRPSDMHMLGGQLHVTYHVFKFVRA